MKTDIFARNKLALQELCLAHKIPKFRASQIIDWLYAKQVVEFAEMKNLGRETIQILQEQFTNSFLSIRCLKELTASSGNTSKVVLAFADGETCESVCMRHNYGNSICVSSQIGCAVGCKFCASGLGGFKRNLTAGEMLAQVMYFAKQLKANGERVSHVVIMGSGEPLLNYENVLEFIRLLHDPELFNISYRNITLSTSGIIPGIKRLQTESLPINLAISLHASEQEKRTTIMPINASYCLHEVVECAGRYAQNTKRQVTYEYIMLAAVNDSLEDAAKLVSLLRGQLACVNLIPANNVQEYGLQKSPLTQVKAFQEYLQKNNIPVTIRKEMGADINAACGQLRNKIEELE